MDIHKEKNNNKLEPPTSHQTQKSIPEKLKVKDKIIKPQREDLLSNSTKSTSHKGNK